jgi:hypothetical protein
MMNGRKRDLSAASSGRHIKVTPRLSPKFYRQGRQKKGGKYT